MGLWTSGEKEQDDISKVKYFLHCAASQVTKEYLDRDFYQDDIE
jgi:hypothetical protein